MPKPRIFSCGVALSVCALVPAFAQAPAINVKPGLWEMVSDRSSKGLPQTQAMPQLPPDMLAQLPPEQSKRIENVMKAARVQQGGRKVKQSCVTREQLARGLAFGSENRPNCKRTVNTQSATRWELTEICSDRRGQQTIHARYEAPTPKVISGTVDITMDGGGRKMSMKQTMRGRWLGPDCGNVKPK